MKSAGAGSPSRGRSRSQCTRIESPGPNRPEKWSAFHIRFSLLCKDGQTYLDCKNAGVGVDLEELPDDGSVVGQGVDDLAVSGVGIVRISGLHLEHLATRAGVLQ